MVSIRLPIIQDILKNINRRLSVYDIIALCCLILVIIGALFYIKREHEKKYTPVTYIEGSSLVDDDVTPASDIFASRSGTTYTYSWCQGASRIKATNRIYFISEDEAKATGRRLSKLCK